MTCEGSLAVAYCCEKGTLEEEEEEEGEEGEGPSCHAHLSVAGESAKRWLLVAKYNIK